MPANRFRLASLICSAAVIVACSSSPASNEAAANTDQTSVAALQATCDPDNGGLTLPAGYCAKVFADNIGHARHLAVASNGDVYVNTWTTERTKTPPPDGGYIVALRDADRDGRAETSQRFGTVYTPGAYGGGTGIAVHGGGLYVEVDDRIVRYRLSGTALLPESAVETVLAGLPRVGDHQAHPFVIAANGTMYVNSGSQTNACQVKNRTLQSPGQKPCAELDMHAGVWRYSADTTNQTFSARERVATGLRNTLAMAVDPRTGNLYAVVHGRDQLFENWPKLYTEAENTEAPAEVLVHVQEGRDYGWPKCYFDGAKSAYILAPEYGGDGEAVRGCENVERPIMTFPAHWAPEAMVLARADSPWTEFRNGAFVSFHGSWNRAPTQSGFLVAFVPFNNGQPGTRYVEFATGFAGQAPPATPDQAAYRPMGLAFGPDGALYVSDDVKGRIWRIVKTTK